MTDDLIAQLEAVADGGFREVDAGGVTLRLRPVTLVECLRLLRRFPALKSGLFGGEADDGTLFDVLLDAGPEAIAALVAASSGRLGDAKLEAVIARLPDDVLIPAVLDVVALTMPEGLEAFFERLINLAGAAGLLEEAPAAKPAAKPQSRVRKADARTTRS